MIETPTKQARADDAPESYARPLKISGLTKKTYVGQAIHLMMTNVSCPEDFPAANKNPDKASPNISFFAIDETGAIRGFSFQNNEAFNLLRPGVIR